MKIVQSKTILRKNRKGGVQKILREHYLRTDIHCGYSACIECNASCILPPSTRLLDGQMVIVLDYSMILHQMDIVEHQCVDQVVLLRTVLDVIRDKSMALYNRARQLVGGDGVDVDITRQFYVLSNENMQQLYVQRQKGESLQDRNCRAIMTALEWYCNHLPSVQFQFLTANSDTAIGAQNLLGHLSNLQILTVQQFVELHKVDAPELLDMVAQESNDADTMAESSTGQVYRDYLSNSQIQSGLLSGKLFQGKISIALNNVFEGQLHTSIGGKDVTIKVVGKQSLNRAIHDDVVVVQLLPKSQWKIAAETIIDEEGDLQAEVTAQITDADGLIKDASDDMVEQDDNNADPPIVSEGDIPVAQVVGIVKRNWRCYAGVIDASRVDAAGDMGAQSRSVWFYPSEKRIPKIRIKTRQLNQLKGQRFLVNIDGWSVNDNFPSGHFVRTLGQLGDKATELESLLHEHDVRYQVFSNQILSELPADGANFKIPEQEYSVRRDLRSLNICSIDPPGCTDIDDALHCRKLSDNLWECGVHIADVTYFVKPDTAMDQEASVRGTTVYLVDQRIDMLPPLLGTNLCSLRSNVERLAFSVIWQMTEQGEILKTEFCKSIIQSKASLTYEEAQRRVDDSKMQDELTQSIRQLNRFAKLFKQKRQEAGSLTLSSPEVRFQLERDTQDPVDVEMKELKETNALVEEFMLLANIAVAKQIYTAFPEVAVLRRHPQPPQSNFDQLKQALQPYGITLQTETSKQLADSLNKAIVQGDDYFNTLVRILTTRCMMQAVYFCSGQLSDNEYWHYGLATEIYTHFTSPIRRYADVMVHRLLAASINADESVSQSHLLFDRVRMSEICDNLNYRHRQAQQAGRSSVELYTHLFFRGKQVDEVGYVTAVMKNGASVIVPKYGIEGFVHASPSISGRDGSANQKDGGDSYEFVYDAENRSLSSPAGTLKVFTKVKVRITIDESTVAGLRQRLRMELTK
ncbi:hypothetical protein MP228_004649 [Amoeboaphelidium protococcarum]|nr:hypothetical protein MP228_004649 [Amoeboaphelidium protococcarum]